MQKPRNPRENEKRREEVRLALRATGQRNLPAVKIAVTALNSSGGSGSSSE
jgi:hypothetical protein